MLGTDVPYFDLEDFLYFAHESKISSDLLKSLLDKWEEWSKKLKSEQIKHNTGSWLVLWLPEEVEKNIDDVWDKSPGEGLLFNSLANYLCMTAIQEIMPQILDGGCAPAPHFTRPLREELTKLGLMDINAKSDNLNRRFAILTNYPFKGGCEICSLQEECPKLKGQMDGVSIVLPGHEKGI